MDTNVVYYGDNLDSGISLSRREPVVLVPSAAMRLVIVVALVVVMVLAVFWVVSQPATVGQSCPPNELNATACR